MKVAVYSLHTTEGLAEHGSMIFLLFSCFFFLLIIHKYDFIAVTGIQFKLNLCFEHKLNKVAYSMCHGNFGGHRSREFICAVSMDCTLTFFEQDGISYETTLAGERHIPSPIIYDSRLDNFFIISSHCDLECYRYQDLGQTLDTTKSKAIQPIWTVCIGEFPLSVQFQQVSE